MPGVRRQAFHSARLSSRAHIPPSAPLLLGAAEGDVPRRGRAGAAAARRQLRRRPGRVTAAVVEQHHDERGIVWPQSVAPYDVHIVALPGLEEQAAELEQRLEARELEVLLDDRELRAGEKFADADLIGCPYRITVGKKTLEDGAVDVLVRQTGEEQRVPWTRWRSDEKAAVQRAALRRDGDWPHGRDRRDVPRPRSEDRPLCAATSTTSCTATAPCPSNESSSGSRSARRRARALPRVSRARDHRAARAHAGLVNRLYKRLG